MVGAFTTLKVAPSDHQALIALLKFLSRKITPEEFRSVLTAQGRSVGRKDTDPSNVAQMIADYLIGPFS